MNNHSPQAINAIDTRKNFHMRYRWSFLSGIARQFIVFTKVVLLLCCQPVFADTTTEVTPTDEIVSYKLRQADCDDFINESPARVSCGFFDLPADHDVGSERTVSIPILIAGQTRSMSKSNRAILIPGGGGPGGSVGFGYLNNPGDYLAYYESLRAAGFDIVVVDQRGAGFSAPLLKCSETTRNFKSTIERDLPMEAILSSYTDAITRCKTRLEQNGIVPADFDTYQSAKDFISIMNSLPYERWGTLATSYATVIAQAMEIIEPETFERIVLDSPVPVDYQQPYTLESSNIAISRILTLCEQTSRCNKKHKDIKQKFSTIVDRAKTQPYQISIKIYDDDASQRVGKNLIVNDTTLLDILIMAAYSNHYLAIIPKIIDELYKKGPRALTEIAEEYWYGNTDLDFADGLSWTVHCKERQPLEDQFLKEYPDHQKTYSNESLTILQQEHSVCSMWDVGRTEKLRIKKPFTPQTLIISGDLDPVISRADVDNTADDFINKQVTIIAGMGHSTWFQSACTRANVTGFFAQDEQDFKLVQCGDGITGFK